MRLLAALCALVIPLAGFVVATEYVATHCADLRSLGAPWAVVAGIPVYAPWAWTGWSRVLEPHEPALVRTASAIATLSAVVGTLLSGLLAAAVRKSSRSSDAHGSSRWATTAEMRKASLLRDAGVVLCQTAEAAFDARFDRTGRLNVRAKRLGTLVRHDGPEHVLCFAPTGSGKGVGLVVPTLLTWPHSVLVYDIKKENWALTAGWRRKFSRVWRFEPTAPDSLRFNPLLEVRMGLHEVRDVQNIADILVDPSGEKDTRDHWQTTAHSLLCGAILHVLYAEDDKTLAGVAAFLSDPSRKQIEVLQCMLSTSHLPDGPHPVVAQVAREMANKSENELSGVYSTAMACLGLYRDPVIARSTSASDFRIADLVGADAPVSLYLVVPPSDLTRTRPVIRLLLNQIGRRLTESMQGSHRHRLLLLLDEFPTLGRLDFFESALAFIRGYGIKAFLIVQSLEQLEKTYGAHNSILGNCHVRLTYAANDDRTARRISEMLGQATQAKLQTSRSGSGFWLSNRSESTHEYGRPLLTPGEVAQLPESEAILFVGGMLPYRAKKVRHFVDPRFHGRAGLPPPDRPDDQAKELLAAPAGLSRAFESLAPGESAPAPLATAPSLDGAALAAWHEVFEDQDPAEDVEDAY